MKRFSIYHLNDNPMFQQHGLYILVYTLEANNLDEAYYYTQNDFSPKYAMLKKRSTSVGDIILDHITGKRFFVSGFGFSETEHLLQGELQHKIDSYEESIADFHIDQEVTNGQF